MVQRSGVGLRRVAQVAVTVQDLERAVGFYRDVLALPLLLHVPQQLALFDCAGMRLMLSLPEGEFQRQASILYFDVADVQASHEALRGRGVELLSAPHKVADWQGKELWMVFFRDSERNPMALVEERAVQQ